MSRDISINGNGTETYSSDLEAFMANLANRQLTIASGGKTVTLELSKTSLHCKYHGERFVISILTNSKNLKINK